MSGISSVGSGTSSSTTTGTLGNVPPISFPGIASGIDYNAIIEKLTSLTLAQNQPLTAENNNLASQNKELTKINGLIQNVQSAIQSLGDSSLFNQFSATSSNTSFASAEQISGQTPQPGTTTILSQSLGTSTVISSDPAANKPVSTSVTLATAGFQITPSNGSGTSGGKFTVDGQQITFDVGTDTVQTILNKLNALTGVKATFQNDQLTLTSTNGQPLSIGSASDSGNLEQIFKLDTSPIVSGQQEISAGTISPQFVSNGNGVALTDTLGGVGGDGVTANGTLTINGNAIAYTTGETVGALQTAIDAVAGLSATIVNGQLVIGTTGGGPVTITETGGGNFLTTFKGGMTQAVTGADTLGGDGVTASGQLTINGTVVNYTTGETVTALEAAINAISGVSASLQGGQLVIATTNGTALNMTETGAGNFLTTFNGGESAATGIQSVTSSSAVGGIDPNESLNLVNSSVALNGGTLFTINGVAISINPATENLQDVINAINTSNAGVIASWNTTTGELQLVSKATGPQSIVLGAPGDSSNFLQAFGLTTAGATTQVGQQASVTYESASGNPTTIYSNSNAVTNVIPGVTLNLLQNSASYTVTVAQSSTSLISSINAFVKAYNTAINEINTASAPPVVTTQAPGTPLASGSAQSNVAVPGGVLFGNDSVAEMKDQLVQMVSDLYQNGSSSYNSFASIGLQLDSSVSVISSTSTTGSNDSADSAGDSGLQTQTFDGTSGQLQALDTSTFDAALAADPAAVQSLFTADSGVLGQVGTYLTYVTGTPTSLGPNNPFLAQVPDTSLLQSIETGNSNQIDSINQQIALINDEATAQANQLRAQFTASETLIAQLQQEQSSLSSILGSASSTTSS